MANNDFLYDANEVMRIIGKQCCCEYINSDFMAVLDAHNSASCKDNTMFAVAIDFYLLGLISGKRRERAEKNRKEYKPIICEASQTILTGGLTNGRQKRF